MLRLIKAWLEMPVEEDDGKGGKRRTNRARRERNPIVGNFILSRYTAWTS